MSRTGLLGFFAHMAETCSTENIEKQRSPDSNKGKNLLIRTSPLDK
jgi:hypothetical protein